MRDRLEMILLSDMGHRMPETASVLGGHQQTLCKYLKLFMAMSQGQEVNFSFDRLSDAPRSGRPPVLTTDHVLTTERLLDEGGPGH